MRTLTLLLSLLLLYHSGFAQKKNLIIDSLTKEPIAYASIACNETGYSIMANEKGEWIFPDSVQCKTITVSCAGYKNGLAVSSLNVIVLAPQIINLQPIEIAGNGEEVSFNNLKELNCSYGFQPDKASAVFAAYLPNPLKKNGWVKQISFHVASIRKPDLDVPVRIRFFEWDEVSQLPGKEISTQNFIIKPKKKNWNNINIAKMNQEIPANGIVVAFELISSGPEHYHEFTYLDMEKKKHIGTYYGWYLTASCCTDCEIQGFTFHNEKWRLWYSKTKANKWAPAVKLKMKYYN